MRKDTLYLTLSRDITSYTITSGQRAIATNVTYAVTIESPTLTTNLAGRDVSVIISDTEGNTLTTATTFYPDTKNPYKAVTGSLLLDGTAYAKFFDGKPVDTAVRLPIVIRDKSATLLSSDIVVMNGGENAEPSASDETIAGLVNAIRFYDLAEFKAWLDGTKTRDDGLRPTDIVVGQWVHTQNDGSFICKELIGSEPSVTKNFTAIVTQFPLTGTLKMNPANGVGLSLYSGDVYNEADATSFSTDAITYKGDAFTFNAGDNQVARQKDNYALENRVNSTMTATLNAVKADNANTYQAMLPVMNTTVEARDRAETAAQGAKSSETRAVEAETNAATSEANALAYKNSAAASEENAGLYRQQALASAQKAEQEAVTATTKAGEAASSASKAATSATDALYYKNSAETFSDSAESWSHSASEYAAAADTSAGLAKESEDNAAKSEANAATSAANAASSESKSLTYKETAVASADLSTTNKNSAADFSASASASASSAASSATAAANSASAAKQSATDLAGAVATAESLDGRITDIEDNGLVYNPLRGTPFIIEREIIAGVYLVRLRDYPSSNFSLVSNGEHYVATYNYGRTFAFLDKDLKPLREIAIGFNSNAHSPSFVHNGQLWVSCLSSTYMPSNKTGIICVYDVSDATSAPTVVAKTMKIIGDYNKNDIIALFLNRLTGNVLCIRNTMVNTGSYALEVYRLTVDGDTFAYDYVHTLEGISLSGNNPYPLINYFANRVFVTLVMSSVSYLSGFNPWGNVSPVNSSVESRLLVTGYDDKLHWIDTALPPADPGYSELPIRFGVRAVGTYFGSSVSSNIMTSATPGLQYHSTKSYTDKNGISRPCVLMTNGVATFWSDGEDDDGNLIWKTSWDRIFNPNSFGLFTPIGAYNPVVLCTGRGEISSASAGYLRPTAFVYRNDVSLSAQAVGNCVRVKTTGSGGYAQNGIIVLGESGNVGPEGFYGSSGGLVGSDYGVACDRRNASPTALVFTRP